MPDLKLLAKKTEMNESKQGETNHPFHLICLKLSTSFGIYSKMCKNYYMRKLSKEICPSLHVELNMSNVRKTENSVVSWLF